NERAEALSSLRLIGVPRKFGPKSRLDRAFVRLIDVRQRYGFAAVGFTNRLVVRQVDSDRRHRSGVAGFYYDVDRVRADALDTLLPISEIPRHVIFEPLRMRSD